MRRSYRTDKYLGILDRVRTAMPHAMITTDIIVGFPGETEKNFQETIDLTTTARFSAAYTYKYSIRPGTPAGVMENQVPEDVVGERYTRLHQHLEKISLAVNQASVGTRHKVLVSEVEGRRDQVQSRMRGRTEDFRLAHFDINTGARPGDIVDVEISEASSHYLIGNAVGELALAGEMLMKLGLPKFQKLRRHLGFLRFVHDPRHYLWSHCIR